MSTHIYIRKPDKEYLNDNYDKLLSALHTDRKKKTQRYTNRSAACMSIAAGLMLEEVASECLMLMPGDIQIGVEYNGKPYIIGYDNFFYNISHSGDYVAIAYGDRPVGVDIEHIRCGGMRKTDVAVARRCFTDEEYAYVTADDELFTERFCRIWTMKESLLKLKGIGVSIPLDSFSADLSSITHVNTYDEIGTAITAGVKDKPYQYLSLVIEDYILTLCDGDVSDVNIVIK